MKQNQSRFLSALLATQAVTGNLMVRPLPVCVVGVLFMFALLMSGCSTTGIKLASDTADLNRLRSIAVHVEQKEPFSLLLSADQSGMTGVILLGVTGGAMEHVIRAGIDQREANKLEHALNGLDALQLFQEKLIESLRSSGRFDSVDTLPSDAGQLIVTVDRWGLRPGLRRERAKKDFVQLGFEYRARIHLPGNVKPSWELKDIYLHGQERPLHEYHSVPGLLRTELESAVEEVAFQLSSKIRLSLQTHRR